MHKVILVDVETTGVTDNSAVTQLSGLIEIDGVVVEEFDFRARPHDGADISEEALKITNMTIEELETFQSPRDMLKRFIDLLDKYIDKYDRNDKCCFIAHNSNFDYYAVQRFCKRLGFNYINSYIDSTKRMCTMETLRAFSVLGLVNLKSYKLEDVCKYFGIDTNVQLHSAIEDIRLTHKVLNKIREISNGLTTTQK